MALTVGPNRVVLEEALMLPATEVVFPEEEPDGCCNFDIEKDRRTAPGVSGRGYVPLSHSGTSHQKQQELCELITFNMRGIRPEC